MCDLPQARSIHPLDLHLFPCGKRLLCECLRLSLTTGPSEHASRHRASVNGKTAAPTTNSSSKEVTRHIQLNLSVQFSNKAIVQKHSENGCIATQVYVVGMIILDLTANPLQCKPHKNKYSFLQGTTKSPKPNIVPGTSFLPYK